MVSAREQGVPKPATRQIRIEQVRVGDLHGFASRAFARAGEGDVLPISERRALAQSRNPYAAEEDIGLLVAYHRGKCVGYLGVLPGRMTLRGAPSKVDWLTTWFVASHLRGRRVGHRLLEEAFGLGYDLFATNYSPSAARVMRAAGFLEFGPVRSYVLDVRRAAPWVSPITLVRRRLRNAGREENNAARLARAVARRLSRPAKAQVYRVLLHSLQPHLSHTRWVEVDAIDEERRLPREGSASASSRFVRGPGIVNWMLRYPWISEAEASVAEGRANYHFSSVRRLFRRVPVELHSIRTGEYRGYALLSVADIRERTVLRVLDHQLADPEAYAATLAAALHYARWYEADSVVLPASFAPHLGWSFLSRLLLTHSDRPYLCRPREPGGTLARSLNAIQLDYCDGDIAFNS